jgi:hypothetical protein
MYHVCNLDHVQHPWHGNAGMLAAAVRGTCPPSILLTKEQESFICTALLSAGQKGTWPVASYSKMQQMVSSCACYSVEAEMGMPGLRLLQKAMQSMPMPCTPRQGSAIPEHLLSGIQ